MIADAELQDTQTAVPRPSTITQSAAASSALDGDPKNGFSRRASLLGAAAHRREAANMVACSPAPRLVCRLQIPSRSNGARTTSRRRRACRGRSADLSRHQRLLRAAARRRETDDSPHATPTAGPECRLQWWSISRCAHHLYFKFG